MFRTSRLPWFLFSFSLFAFFVPLFILPFFNHPFADDYICGIHLRREGFLQYQSFIYQNWGGRFSATFTGSLLAERSFLYDHYFLHSLLLLILNIISLYFLVSRAFLYVLKEKKSFLYLLSISLLSAALEYSSSAEPSTYLFWFSSAITYLAPVILLTFQAGFWLQYYYTKKTATKRIASFLIVLLIVIINGFNECFIIAQMFLIAVLLLTGVFKKNRAFLLLILPAFITSAAFVLLAPGNSSRSSLLVTKSIATGITVSGFQIFEVLWNIGKNPLFWISLVTVYFFSNQRKDQFVSSPFFQTFSKKLYLLPAFILLFLACSIGLAVIGLKGGIIPDRYLNAVISITIFLFLFLSFFVGISSRKRDLQTHKIHLQTMFCVAISCGLFANDFFKEEYQSLISAPVYNTIMNERKTLLKQSAGQKSVQLDSYDVALEKAVTGRYKSNSATVSGWLSRKPSFLFYTDDLANEYNRETLAEYYKVKRVAIK